MNHHLTDNLKNLSRRHFIKSSAAGMAAALASKNVLFAAQARKKFRVGLIGCGGRGTGALENCF
jgi:molybdopterin/thiamine biosynthesis adenylyltransferase